MHLFLSTGVALMKDVCGTVSIVGAGFVADLYMRSLKTFPNIRVVSVYDINQDRLDQFCAYWNVTAANSLASLLEECPKGPSLILNLTNPSSHYEISKAALEAGHHVYSEKPLATNMTDACFLCALAEKSEVLLTSAPCSWLSEAAQTVWKSISSNEIGVPRLIYAELDDDYIPQAPYQAWLSESGAPWPAKDEFETGCTVEHAGYYLTWLMAVFGPVDKVVAASANLLPDKLPDGAPTAPDFSVATLFFHSGLVARLTCSIVAPHDHCMRIIGDDGVLELHEGWDNSAPVRIRKRHVVRRRLMNSPIARRTRIAGDTHPKVGRWGAASMNFALGPVELLQSIHDGRAPRIDARFALHLNEITLAIQNAGSDAGAQKMTTSFPPVSPMPWAEAAGALPAGA